MRGCAAVIARDFTLGSMCLVVRLSAVPIILLTALYFEFYILEDMCLTRWANGPISELKCFWVRICPFQVRFQYMSIYNIRRMIYENTN